MKTSVLLLALSLPLPSALAFDVVDDRTSYIDSKFITLGVGLGFTGLTQTEGLDNDPGFGFRLSAGHHFNKYLETEIYYQFSAFRIRSPDPINLSSHLSTRTGMHQEAIRFLVSWPALLLQPYVAAGFGGYHFAGVAQQTALSFPLDMMIPLAVGLRAYTFKNMISFQLEFSHDLIFGENQPSDVLSLLGLKEVSFDSYTFMTSFVFHFL